MVNKQRGSASRQIYLLREKDLPPEVIAVTFAKTSRSPKSFKEIAAELSEEDSAKFHERWVVGYGHGSIAEHAVLHIALENVSRLAIEAVESNRLCSYTEKSSRYQTFDSFYIPQRIASSHFSGLYTETCQILFDTYNKAIEPVKNVIQGRFPKRESESDRAYDSRIRSKYSDVCRYLLPTAALANVGMTANARNLEHAITKMLSHPLEEVQEIGKEIKRVALEEVPTLIKHADRNRYLVKTEEALKICTRAHLHACTRSLNREPLTLIDYDEEAEDRFVAACLYRGSALSYEDALKKAKEMEPSEKERVIDEALKSLGPHDKPLRELEHVYYTFDCLVDQGAYRDLARHRMMTQTPQRLTVEHGYAVPRAIEEAGLRKEFEEAIDKATEVYYKISEEYPAEACYLITNAHNRRLLMTLNLRELFYFCALRTRESGHFSYRRIAMRMYELVQEKHPLLLKYLRFDKEYPSSAGLEQEYFAETVYKSKTA